MFALIRQIFVRWRAWFYEKSLGVDEVEIKTAISWKIIISERGRSRYDTLASDTLLCVSQFLSGSNFCVKSFIFKNDLRSRNTFSSTRRSYFYANLVSIEKSIELVILQNDFIITSLYRWSIGNVIKIDQRSML